MELPGVGAATAFTDSAGQDAAHGDRQRLGEGLRLWPLQRCRREYFLFSGGNRCEVGNEGMNRIKETTRCMVYWGEIPFLIP